MLLPNEWAAALALRNTVAGGLAILASATAIGLFIGSVRVRGVKLGVAGVLFSALIFGQLGLGIDPRVLEFLRDFALILFMYAIGLQVGPGFVSSLRADGLRLNGLSIAVLILGAIISGAVGYWLPTVSGSGLFTGAFTTTPGLAAAQEAVRRVAGPADEISGDIARIGLAYSIAYPFGVVGPIFVILILRKVFRVQMAEERVAMALEDQKRRPPIETMDFEVTEPTYAGQFIRDLEILRNGNIILSRLMRDGGMSVPMGNTQIRTGDVYRAVATREQLDKLVAVMGHPSKINLDTVAGDVRRLDLVVTRSQVLRKSFRELDLIRRTGVTVARINRAGVDLVPTASLRLTFADRLTVVGPLAGLKIVEAELGNSPESLDRPQVAPIFLGIVLGVLVGSIPIFVPGLNISVRIGLAGGPLIAAIALSQLGSIGSIVWYMPTSANQLFRDFGLAVFLACVGFRAGDHFIQRAASTTGIALFIWGAVITILPAVLVGCFARKCLRMNFVTLAGWVAGAMTSSPALLFANELSQSDTPAVAYAAVAPLATLIPILCAQILAIAFR